MHVEWVWFFFQVYFKILEIKLHQNYSKVTHLKLRSVTCWHQTQYKNEYTIVMLKSEGFIAIIYGR